MSREGISWRQARRIVAMELLEAAWDCTAAARTILFASWSSMGRLQTRLRRTQARYEARLRAADTTTLDHTTTVNGHN